MLSSSSYRQRRAASIAPIAVSTPGVSRQEITVPGDPEVVIRVYRPLGVEGPLPCVFSVHGGWYVLGSAAMDDQRLMRWSRRFHCVGVTVEYRLAPETAYPGPLDDCYRALQWILEQKLELGIDPELIGVAGTSAGAGLAAAIALRARDAGNIPLRFQLLDAPMIDDRMSTPSSQASGLVTYDPETCRFGWASYLGTLFGSDDVPAYAAAARADDLAGLPEAYICVGDVDGFRDDAISYAMRLLAAGVPTELHVHPGAPHGVKSYVDTPIERRYSEGIESWLQRQLGPRR